MWQAFRASFLHCLADPGATSLASAYAYFDDGVLVVEDGVVVELGEAAALLPQLGDAVALQEFPEKLIVPGFIDCHTHFPQLDIIASYGEKLLDW